MTLFAEKLLDMTEDQITTALANILSEIRDISTATDKSFTITVAPDMDPVLVVDGKVSNDFIYDKIPGFEGTMEQLNNLTIWK